MLAWSFFLEGGYQGHFYEFHQSLSVFFYGTLKGNSHAGPTEGAGAMKNTFAQKSVSVWAWPLLICHPGEKGADGG